MTTRRAQHAPLQESTGSDTPADGPSFCRSSGPAGAGPAGNGARAGVAHGRRARFHGRNSRKSEILAASNYLGYSPAGSTVSIGSPACAALNYQLLRRLRIGPLRIMGAALPEPRRSLARRALDLLLSPVSAFLDWLDPKFDDATTPDRGERPSIFRDNESAA